MSVKFPFFWGGGFGGGGRECRFYFYGRADFSETLSLNCRDNPGVQKVWQ